MSNGRTERAIEAAWRIDAPRIIAAIARMTGDVATAEDFAQDALVAALRSWPEQGVPDNPGAWLMATAKRRAIDHLRRGRMLDRKHEQVAYDADQATTSPESDIMMHSMMTSATICCASSSRPATPFSPPKHASHSHCDCSAA